MSSLAIGTGVGGAPRSSVPAGADRRARAGGRVRYAAMDGWRKARSPCSARCLSSSRAPIRLGGAALHPDGCGRLARRHVAQALRSGQRRVLGVPRALANATVGACAAFGAICGSSIATAATFSRVAIPEMRRHGYHDAIAAGSVAAAGTLGILIPPSVILAIYSLVAEQSLAKLFAAALIPGLLLSALYVITVVIVVRVRPAWTPRVAGMTMRERLRGARGMWKLALLFSSQWSASISAGSRPPRARRSAPSPRS